jgi:hypothetical protein
MDTNEPRVFLLDPARQVVAARRRMRWMLAFVIVLCGAFQLFYWYLGRGRPNAISGSASLISFVVLSVLLTVMMLRAAKRAARSYRLILGEDWLRIEVDQLLPIELRRQEIHSVQEGRGGLQIFRQRGLPVGITRAIDGYLEIRDRVMAWVPAAPAPTVGLSPRLKATLNVVAVLGLFVLSGLSYVATTATTAFLLAGPAAASGLWLWWAFRDVPIKRIWILRAYVLLAAVGVVFLNVLRWTVGGR